MVFVHRFIGQWLDENKSANQEETLSKALKKGSGIDEYLKEVVTRVKFEMALEEGEYDYMVPKEVAIEETKDDKYYRLELNGYEGSNSYTAFYGNGSSIFVKATFEGKGEIAHIYEYDTKELLLEDLKDEVHITFLCDYNPCYLLAKNFDEFKVTIDFEDLYCYIIDSPEVSIPITEIEI